MADEITNDAVRPVRSVKVNIRDINPLEHITSDIAKSRANYESILNGLVLWNSSKGKNVTVRLMTDTDPGFVDYTFPTRAAYARDEAAFLTADIREGSFDCGNRLVLPAMDTDHTVLRLSADGGSGCKWRLYEDAAVTDIDAQVSDTAAIALRKGQYVRLKSSSGHYETYYVTADITPGTDTYSAKVKHAICRWNSGTAAGYADIPGMVMLYSRGIDDTTKAYIRKSGEYDPVSGNIEDNWEYLAERLPLYTGSGNVSVVHGRAYVYGGTAPDMYDAGIYIYTGPNAFVTADGPTPYTDGKFNSDSWYGPVVLVKVTDFTGTTVVRHVPTTDINGYMLQARTDIPGDVSVLGNVAVAGGETEPHRGLGIFKTCNYVCWPDTQSGLWTAGRDYTGSESYTAKMIFHHGSEDTRLTNIINYDGPDLDRGLAIYLPVQDKVAGPNGIAEVVTPKDGTMFEFMFRIWPDASLNGRETADLTINKAHIYVYSLESSDDTETGATVIAKFSMARLTNFYVWSENVAVPNRPVFYKARFVYSKTDGEWKTYDYYQVPDQVFLSPAGFVDPSDRSGDAGYTGVETAGFPLMQDPFGGMDLSKVARDNRIG